MLVNKYKDIVKFKNKIIYIHFYDDFCSDIMKNIDLFFQEKYDLNKIYLKIKVSLSTKLVQKMDITTYPIIKIYKHLNEIGEIYCNNDDYLFNLEKLYNNIV